jgi:two-component system, NtrC family, response regulator AtoC
MLRHLRTVLTGPARGRAFAFSLSRVKMSASSNHALEHPAMTTFVHGNSPAIQKLNAAVREIAPTSIPVLLMGESGTGKEVYGRLIHRLSKHSNAPFKKLSCRAQEAGEFLKQLRVDLRGNGEGLGDAQHHTLFLDGIDELDHMCQKVLLSLLPDAEIEHSHPCSARLIASTTRDLKKDVEARKFRRELYFRIDGVCLHLPPLKDRREDVLLLLEHFLAKHAAELGRDVPTVSDTELELLRAQDWPGNVRELENFARRIALFGDSRKAIDELREMPKKELAQPDEPRSSPLKAAARAASRRAERDLISKALERTHWNRKRAAQELQISYKSLLCKIKQTGLEGKQEEAGVKERS